MNRIFIAALFAMTITAQDDGPDTIRTQTRSMTMTKYGVVATSQTLASAAGVKILEAGGSAVDAAITANAVLGVVEPNSNGIGGDLFAIVYEAKSGKLYGLNASGWAPAGLNIDLLTAAGETSMPQRGIHSVTVPGAVAGWDAMHKRFGRLPLGNVLAPAIHYAQEGFPVTEIISEFWASDRARPSFTHENANRLYLKNGRGPQPGELFTNPDLARSLQRIATSGRDGFYKGPTANAIVAISKEYRGTYQPGGPGGVSARVGGADLDGVSRMASQ